jgi:hypothetical protein
MENVKKNHGQVQHPLVWDPIPSIRRGGNPVTCALCKIQFRKAGMFSCNQCENSYCVLCYHDPDRPKPQLQSSNGAQDLTALLLLSSLLRN